MGTKTAMKITLGLLFEHLEDKGIKFTSKQREGAIELMHDDYTFCEELIGFLEDHLETFGGNYGL